MRNTRDAQCAFRESDLGRPPPIEEQKAYWDTWNNEWRSQAQRDSFQQRQHEFAFAAVESLGRSDLRILDVGCGTGWLGDSLKEFGTVTGIDLSEQAIATGRVTHRQVKLNAGDFLTTPLEGPFDVVVQADSLGNMPEPARAISRIASLLAPNGTYLLMSPNYPVWKHRRALPPLSTGQIRRMLSLEELRRLLADDFVVERVSSIDPGGDKGVLFWVENRWVRGGMGRLVGRQRWRSILEKLRLGRELCVVARRRVA
jgi:2-polyprenyl-3-methyl-5-hydroxy-6-metoxy-1,4-benzoquinol methylase